MRAALTEEFEPDRREDVCPNRMLYTPSGNNRDVLLLAGTNARRGITFGTIVGDATTVYAQPGDLVGFLMKIQADVGGFVGHNTFTHKGADARAFVVPTAPPVVTLIPVAIGAVAVLLSLAALVPEAYQIQQDPRTGSVEEHQRAQRLTVTYGGTEIAKEDMGEARATVHGG